MSEQDLPPPGPPAGADSERCPTCDTRNAPGAAHCIACGAAWPSRPPATAGEQPAAPRVRPPARRLVWWRRWPVLQLTAGLVVIVTLWTASRIWRNPAPLYAALFPTPVITLTTPMPTPTPTASPTARPTETPAPTALPTVALTPLPSPTPQSPITHTIDSGETLISIALFYGVTIDSIVTLNNLSPDSIQAGTQILVPQPTATPPLAPVMVDINGQNVLADPTDCLLHSVAEGDSLFGIALRYDVNFNAILQVNRLDERAVLQPGDTVCIPRLVYDETDFAAALDMAQPRWQPTVGGPHLLYPSPGSYFSATTPGILLQWLAERDLAADEQYMVEVTDMSAVESRPQRAFTRQTSVIIPPAWAAAPDEVHTFRWRVALVRITGARPDGVVTYAYGGPASESTFNWGGAPTPTP